MTILLAVTGWPIEPWLERFRHHAPEFGWVGPGERFDPAAIEHAVVWKPRPGLLATLPNLRTIFNLGAGIDALLADPTLPPVPLVRIVDPDLTARMTEYVVFNVLRCHRREWLHREAQAARRWIAPDQPAARDVRVGILGLGELGRDAALALARLGFDVAGWSRSPRRVDGVACHAGAAALPAFLARTDILVALLPLTPATRGLLNRDLLAGLARDGRLGGPFLINAGRGGLQVEADILAALNDGTLAGAVIDVFETEPLPPGHPMWAHPRLVVSPHNAADSDPEAVSRNVVAQLRRLAAGLALESVVDRAAGY